MVRNSNMSETKLVDAAIENIRRRLPPQWTLRDCRRDLNENSPRNSGRNVDAILQIRDPQGLSAAIVVEVRTRPVEPRLVSYIAETLRGMTDLGGGEDARPGTPPVTMLVSSFLSTLTRERLVAAGMSYADSTGNIRFSVDRPAVFIATQGGGQESIQGRSSPSLAQGEQRRPRGQGPVGLPGTLRNPGTGRRDRKFPCYHIQGIRSARAGGDYHPGGTERPDWLGGLGDAGPQMGHGLRARDLKCTDDMDRATGDGCPVRAASELRLPVRRYRFLRRDPAGAGCGAAPGRHLRRGSEAAAGQLGLRPAEIGGNVLILRPSTPWCLNALNAWTVSHTLVWELLTKVDIANPVRILASHGRGRRIPSRQSSL